MAGALLMGCAVLSVRGEMVKVLTVVKTDNTEMNYAIADKPVMSIGDDELRFTAGTVEMSVPLADFSHIYYREIEHSALETVAEKFAAPLFTVTDRAVICRGIAPDRPVLLYSTDGSVVASGRTDADGSATIALTGLMPGTYLLHTDSATFKFLKR